MATVFAESLLTVEGLLMSSGTGGSIPRKGSPNNFGRPPENSVSRTLRACSRKNSCSIWHGNSGRTFNKAPCVQHRQSTVQKASFQTKRTCMLFLSPLRAEHTAVPVFRVLHHEWCSTLTEDAEFSFRACANIQVQHEQYFHHSQAYWWTIYAILSQSTMEWLSVVYPLLHVIFGNILLAFGLKCITDLREIQYKDPQQARILCDLCGSTCLPCGAECSCPDPNSICSECFNGTKPLICPDCNKRFEPVVMIDNDTLTAVEKIYELHGDYPLQQYEDASVSISSKPLVSAPKMTF